MKYVYAVTKYDYEDYYIVAVFSTLEAAKKFRKKNRLPNKIEKFVLDPDDDWKDG